VHGQDSLKLVGDSKVLGCISFFSHAFCSTVEEFILAELEAVSPRSILQLMDSGLFTWMVLDDSYFSFGDRLLKVEDEVSVVGVE
jgi:hypothetical protein